MNKLVRVGLALLVSAAMAVPALAADASVEGVWQPDKNSDYQVHMCGKDSKQFCLKVLAIRGKMDKPENRPYVGTDIIEAAKPSGKNRWKGKLNLFGQSA